MPTILLLATLFAAEPNAEQLKLLKVFRSEFVELTPGKDNFPETFLFGKEAKAQAPGHYAIGKYEVPQNLWEAVMGSNPSKWTGPRNSVEMLSYAEAEDFCKKATELMRAAKLIEPTQAIRLPTEREWEYAARAGTTTAYSFGDDEKELNDYAWHTGNAAGNDPPVGAKKPNAWGLYDVHGYLWEWTTGETDTDAKERPLRSGSWKDKGTELTSATRKVVDAGLRDDAVGLRCVLATEK
jgi:formylglycine-generating enzyme required for sulfatase activity